MRKKSITSEMMESYIADSLLILMKNKNFQSITIGEIVEKAGVNRSTYYRHFYKKEDIILYFLDNLAKTSLEREKAQKLDLERHFIEMYEHYYRHKEQMLTIYKSGLSSLLLDVLKKHLGEDEHKTKQVSVQYDIAFYIGGIFNQFLLWFSRDMIDSPETMAKYTLSMLPPNHVHIGETER